MDSRRSTRAAASSRRVSARLLGRSQSAVRRPIAVLELGRALYVYGPIPWFDTDVIEGRAHPHLRDRRESRIAPPGGPRWYLQGLHCLAELQRLHAAVRAPPLRSATLIGPARNRADALVAQGIEQWPPEPCAWVRIPPRAQAELALIGPNRLIVVFPSPMGPGRRC